MKKKQQIIDSWIRFSKVESRNIQGFINWASYYFDTSKEYIRNVLAEYKSAQEQEKREEEQSKIQKYENMIKEIMEEL